MTVIYRQAMLPDGGQVVRRLHYGWVGNEECWRQFPPPLSRFAHQIGHKGPWITCEWRDIPERVREEFRRPRQ